MRRNNNNNVLVARQIMLLACARVASVIKGAVDQVKRIFLQTGEDSPDKTLTFDAQFYFVEIKSVHVLSLNFQRD